MLRKEKLNVEWKSILYSITLMLKDVLNARNIIMLPCLKCQVKLHRISISFLAVVRVSNRKTHKPPLARFIFYPFLYGFHKIVVFTEFIGYFTYNFYVDISVFPMNSKIMRIYQQFQDGKLRVSMRIYHVKIYSV